jgi:MFS family permease
MSREPLLTRPFVYSFMALFAQAMSFHMYVHLPGFLTDLGADEFVIGLLAGFSASVAIVVRPALGRIMDIEGRRFVILAGGLLNTLSLGLYLTVDQVGPWIFVVRALHGIASAMLFTGFFTFATDTIPASRMTQGIGLFGIAGMIPLGLGPTLGDWILERGSYVEFFQASMGLAIVSLLLSLLIRDQRASGGDGLPPRGLRSTLMQPDLMPLWFIGAVFITATAGPFIFLKTYVIETDLGSVGPFFRSYSLAAICVRLLAGGLPDRFGAKRVFMPSLAVLFLGLAQTAAADSSAGLSAAGLLCGFGHGYCVPILNALIVSRARDAERGAAMAISTALFDVGFLVGGPVFGLIIRQAGYTTMFESSAAMVVAGGALFWLWDRPHAGVSPLERTSGPTSASTTDS